MASTKKQREKFHRKNPFCKFCGRLTYLENKYEGTDSFATVEHINHKWSLERLSPHKPNELRRFLCCMRCNQNRAQIAELKIPIEVRRAVANKDKKEVRDIILDYLKSQVKS